MKRVLVICATHIDRRELSLLQLDDRYTIFFHNYDNRSLHRIMCKGIGWLSETFDPEAVIDDIVRQCKEKKIDAVISTEDYPGSIFASIVANKLNLLGPDPQKILLCHHKYYARQAQAVCVPQAAPNFWLVNADAFEQPKYSFAFPVFIKPVKSFFSILTNCAHNLEELRSYLPYSVLPEQFLAQFNWFLQHYSSYELGQQQVLVEEFLQGIQTTLEGYVYHGDVEVLGIVDSIMFPGTVSFKRFEYPSHLSQTVQDRMSKIAKKFITRIDLNNTFFNIEFMYNPQTDQLFIIEINPRMTTQFADLFEKVDGTNTYELLLALVSGDRPIHKKGKGSYACAASCVLRTFEDKKVISTPSDQDLKMLYDAFPDARVRITATKGKKLSDEFQDGKSYRYGLVHLGGSSREDIQRKFEQCKEYLPFEFEPVID